MCGIVHCGQGGSASLMLRNWLCSVSRVGPPQRDSAPSRSVSGVPAPPAANRSTLALFCLPGKVARVGPQFPPGQFFSGSKMPKTVSILTVLLGEILYFQPPANQKESILTVWLRSVLRKTRPSPNMTPCPPSAPTSIAWNPAPVVTASCPLRSMLTPAGSGIQLKLKALTQTHSAHRAP